MPEARAHPRDVLLAQINAGMPGQGTWRAGRFLPSCEATQTTRKKRSPLH
jgi:hypothetical protein